MSSQRSVWNYTREGMGALRHLIIVVVIGMVFRWLWKSSLDEHASAEAGRTLFPPTRAIRFLAVFQIGYDTGRAQARTKQLRLHGYEVVSVVGNEAAKLVLTLPQECDFFIETLGFRHIGVVHDEYAVSPDGSLDQNRISRLQPK